MREFKDRVAVVTGAANGIGRAMAHRFAAEGMKVVLADIETGALAEAEAEIKATGAAVLAVRTDVSQAAAVDALAKKTLDTFGAVHLVCNNAGVSNNATPVWENPLENWQWVLGVNLWGVIHGVRTFIPIMLEQGTEAHMVNTASMAGLLSVPFGSVYHATKHAVLTLCESLYFELEMMGAKVKVSVLCPGAVKTNIMHAERHRPPEFSTQVKEVSEIAKTWDRAYKQIVEGGIPPADVAGVVLDAIREERFYIFPHPEILSAVRGRTQIILKQGNPTLAVPEETREQFGLLLPSRGA